MTIKEAREKAGITQAEMNRVLKIPIRTIQDWEAGRRTPSEWVQELVINALLDLKK